MSAPARTIEPQYLLTLTLSCYFCPVSLAQMQAFPTSYSQRLQQWNVSMSVRKERGGGWRSHHSRTFLACMRTFLVVLPIDFVVTDRSFSDRSPDRLLLILPGLRAGSTESERSVCFFDPADPPPAAMPNAVRERCRPAPLILGRY